MEEQIYITHNVQETEALAKDLAPMLKSAPAVALYGGLGMGKTDRCAGLYRAGQFPHLYHRQ